MIIYHSTLTRNLTTIFRHGLSGNPIHVSSMPSYASLVEFLHDGPVTTLAIDAEGLQLEPGWDGPDSMLCRSTIDPSRIFAMIK